VQQKPFIASVSGTGLTEDERAFFRRERPCGCIIFRRNVEAPDQLRRLVSQIREAADVEHFLVLVDQEGGRVQRLSPPHWRAYPPAASFRLRDQIASGSGPRAASLIARLLAEDLHALGINVDCAPVLDVPVAGADGIIGDRAYAMDADEVALYGRAFAQGLLDGGVLPVIKHIPGHGRAKSDSHFFLPVIESRLDDLARTDFAPFAALRDMPLAMTAHIILSCLDGKNPVTVSEHAISTIVRGTIGFDGLLLTDDLSMKALSGRLDDRTKAALAAGCDIALPCNGVMREMEAVAGACGPLEGVSLTRFEAAWAQLRPPQAFNRAEALTLLDEMLAATS
jgi:beta-N-acetylhexosaminidase